MLKSINSEAVFISPSLDSYSKLMAENGLESFFPRKEDYNSKINIANNIFEKIELENPEIISFLSGNGISYESSRKFIEDISLLIINYADL